jgi:hypothetical protein
VLNHNPVARPPSLLNPAAGFWKLTMNIASAKHNAAARRYRTKPVASSLKQPVRELLILV